MTSGDLRLGAIGVLAIGATYLLVQRAEGVTHAGAWCFPGGHVEPGETSSEAVVRELFEELGLEVEPVALLGAVRLESSCYELDVWTVRHVSGELRMHAPEIADARYLTIEEIRVLAEVMPSNARVLELLGFSAA